MLPTYQLLLNGTRALVAGHAAGEQTKLGILRAGNTGVVLPDGRIAGKCARQSLLRLGGIDADSVNHSRQLMFAAGHANESDWVDRLVAAGIPEVCIRREEQVPIKWVLPSGRFVTGRPDMVLLEPGTWAPVRGLELKQVSSLWTGRSVAVKSEPKAMHLMQAGHYSWKLGIPFELWYTSRADFQLPMMRNVQWPEYGRPGSEFFEYKAPDAKGDRWPLKMIPFVVGFELGWTDSGELRYRRLSPEGAGVWVTSVISKQGIEKYFQAVDQAAVTDTLPAAPVNVGPTGEPGNYSICDYCPLQSVCANYQGKSLREWTGRVQALVARLAPTGSMRETQSAS